MGNTTRAEFANEIRYTVGNRDDLDLLIPTWINRALSRVAYFPGLLHPELQMASSFTITDGSSSNSLTPLSNFFALDGVYHTTIHKQLKPIDIHRWMKLDHTVTGSPTHFMIRSSGNIRYFWWYPYIASGDSDESVIVLYRREVPLMTLSTSTSPLADDYDQAIIHYASSFGFYALNEDERGDGHLQRAVAAVAQVQSRTVEDTFGDDSGMTVVVEETR